MRLVDLFPTEQTLALLRDGHLARSALAKATAVSSEFVPGLTCLALEAGAYVDDGSLERFRTACVSVKAAEAALEAARAALVAINEADRVRLARIEYVGIT